MPLCIGRLAHRARVLVVALYVPSALALAQTPATPEPPAINRDVVGIIRTELPATGAIEARFERPHVPALRTTSDGRLGVFVKNQRAPHFSLLKPEKANGPVLQQTLPKDDNAYAMSWTQSVRLEGLNILQNEDEFKPDSLADNDDWKITHACDWNDDGPIPQGNDDLYTLRVICMADFSDGNGNDGNRIFSTDVQALVTDPKTANAAIAWVREIGPNGETGPGAESTTMGPALDWISSAFEPMIAGDGRLIVARVFTNNLPTSGQFADIVYSYYEEYDGGGLTDTADVSRWTDFYPVSHAHHDPRINDKFGFAMFPLRDPEGTLIPDMEDMGGTYPWIDRDADNLFFTTIGDFFHHESAQGIWDRTRYEAAIPTPSSEWPEEDWMVPELHGTELGVTVAGLWTHGKMVLLDNLNNDMDYGMGPTGAQYPQQRWVKLYEQAGGASVQGPGVKLLGYGRANNYTPAGANQNTTIIDSAENLLHYRPQVIPDSLRDVAWILNNGKQSDELEFDDYLDPDAFIVANMAGCVSITPNNGGGAPWSGTGRNMPLHHSGWDGVGFNLPVRLQNAATPPAGHRWNVPTHGAVLGNGGGRLEPIANGGVHGRGFWLDDDIRLEFQIPTQPVGTTFADHDWYVGLFVDSRFAETDDDVQRLLLTFPDGTSIQLRGRNEVLFVDSADTVVHRSKVPAPTASGSELDDLLPHGGWSHLGLRVREGGRSVTLLLNGFPLSHWTHYSSRLFQLVEGGALVLGDHAGHAGEAFRGWTDDLKVLAHDVDPESAANHAGGTLVGIEDTWTPTGVDWESDFADRFPDWSHELIDRELNYRGELLWPRYASYHRYHADHATNLAAVADESLESVRTGLLFPEGPVFHDAPRPSTIANRFCITCHNDDSSTLFSSQHGLTLDALSYDPGKNATADPRRQPSQPPARVAGIFPPGLANPGGGGFVPHSSVKGISIDPFLLPAAPGAVSVQSMTLVDASTGRALMDLPLGATGTVVDPALLDATLFTIRANLTSAVGGVDMTFDGGSVNSRPAAPYAVFGTIADPLAGIALTPGPHTVTATPQVGGSGASTSFVVLDASAHAIAQFSTDFRAEVPSERWGYFWNPVDKFGVLESLVRLNWSESVGGYTNLGRGLPESAPSEARQLILSATGGRPGLSLGQGAAQGRNVFAGFTVVKDGWYKVTGIDVSLNLGPYLPYGADGIRFRVQSHDVSTAASTTHLAQTVLTAPVVDAATLAFQLDAGDVITVGAGPRSSDTSDDFDWDFVIEYSDSPF